MLLPSDDILENFLFLKMFAFFMYYLSVFRLMHFVNMTLKWKVVSGLQTITREFIEYLLDAYTI